MEKMKRARRRIRGEKIFKKKAREKARRKNFKIKNRRKKKKGGERGSLRTCTRKA